MIDFSICLETAFTEGERSLPERVRAAADAGFRAVEIWHWRDRRLRDLGLALRQTDTELHTLCVEDWRDKCQLGDPGSHDEFVQRVERAAAVGAELGVRKLVVLAGDIVPSIGIETQQAAARDALARASDVVAPMQMELLVEVVNRQFEGPNALLQDSATALQLLRRLDRPNVRFLYDRYHAILNGEALGWAVEGNMDLVGHIQAADVSGRGAFGTGEHDWVQEFRWLASAGYAGYIGIEAVITGRTEEVLPTARGLLQRAMPT